MKFELSPNAYLQASWQRYKGQGAKASARDFSSTQSTINASVSDRHLNVPEHTKTSSASYWTSSDYQKRVAQLDALELAANAPRTRQIEVKTKTYTEPRPGELSPGYFSLNDYVGRKEQSALVGKNLAGNYVARRVEGDDYGALFLSYGLMCKNTPTAHNGMGRSVQAASKSLANDGGAFYTLNDSRALSLGEIGSSLVGINVDEEFSRLQARTSGGPLRMLNAAQSLTRYRV
ncbi:MAG: hypothetical protein CMH60_02225 [Myxococcales bacterium]|nr:hypothetical protein [Myxococcales bacterium]